MCVLGPLARADETSEAKNARSPPADGQVDWTRNTIRRACVCVCVKKRGERERKKSEGRCERASARCICMRVYEEGKEKEKIFFFSAWRAVVHLEKGISEPAMIIQKEKERTKRGKKRMDEREAEREGERERAITKTNDSEDKSANKNTHVGRTVVKSFSPRLHLQLDRRALSSSSRIFTCSIRLRPPRKTPACCRPPRRLAPTAPC